MKWLIPILIGLPLAFAVNILFLNPHRTGMPRVIETSEFDGFFVECTTADCAEIITPDTQDIGLESEINRCMRNQDESYIACAKYVDEAIPVHGLGKEPIVEASEYDSLLGKTIDLWYIEGDTIDELKFNNLPESLTVPSEPISFAVVWEEQNQTIIEVPQTEDCESVCPEGEKLCFSTGWECLDYENMKMGEYFTKDNPWNMQCEHGYILHFNRDAIVWCEKDDNKKEVQNE